MSGNPLKSLSSYNQYVVQILNRYAIKHSTIVVWSDSPYTGVAEGEVFFPNGIRLRMREELDFEAGLITSYGYEVYHYKERLYWYDDFPHPNDAALSSTFPHHKHIFPNIKHNRIPAPEISFNPPNLPILLSEIKDLVKKLKS